MTDMGIKWGRGKYKNLNTDKKRPQKLSNWNFSQKIKTDVMI